MNHQASTIERVYILNIQASFTALSDAFYERFEKLSALVQISLCHDFDTYPKETTYHYRAVISDMIDELRELQTEIIRKKDQKI